MARLGSAQADHSQLEAKIDQRHYHQIKDLLASELARGAIWGASIAALLAWGAASLKPNGDYLLANYMSFGHQQVFYTVFTFLVTYAWFVGSSDLIMSKASKILDVKK